MAYHSQSVALTWLGHGSVLLEAGTTRVLVDPLLRRRIGHITRSDTVNRAALTGVDAVVITHAHRDHLDLPSLRWLQRANPSLQVLAPRGAWEVLAHAGLQVGEQTGVGDLHVIGDFELQIVPVAHDGGRGPAWPWGIGRAGDAIGLVARGAHMQSIWIAGDTALDPVLEQVGPVDVAAVPIGGWWRTLGPGHMDPEAAARAVALVGAATVIPIHWGTYHPLLLGRWMRDTNVQLPKQFAHVLAREAPHASLRVLHPGQQVVVESNVT